MPYKELDNVYISNLPPDAMAKALQKYNRLRNAVYVTYPYARTAGYYPARCSTTPANH